MHSRLAHVEMCLYRRHTWMHMMSTVLLWWNYFWSLSQSVVWCLQYVLTIFIPCNLSAICKDFSAAALPWHVAVGTGNFVRSSPPFSQSLIFFFFVSLFSLWTKAFLFSIINNSLSALMILLPKLCLRFGHWNPISFCVLVKCSHYFLEHFLSFWYKMFQFHLLPFLAPPWSPPFLLGVLDS